MLISDLGGFFECLNGLLECFSCVVVGIWWVFELSIEVVS